MLRLEADVALDGFDLGVAVEVGAGECLAVVGPSGAGKSTLLRVAAGLVRPRGGLVRCGDELWLDTTTGFDLPPERRRVGYLFQEYALFGHLSAWQNVAYGMRGGSRADRRRAALTLLDQFGLADRADARPRILSGGERQRVALARALATAPAALLLDEPLSALDVQARAAGTRQLLQTLRASTVPTVLVTHDFAEAATLGTSVAVIDRGRIVQTGTAEELSAAPATAFVASLVGAVVLDSPRGQMCLYPWELRLWPVDLDGQPRIEAVVESITVFGSRARVGLATVTSPPRQLTVEAEVTDLRLRVGSPAAVTWDPAVARELQSDR